MRYDVSHRFSLDSALRLLRVSDVSRSIKQIRYVVLLQQQTIFIVIGALP